MAELMDRIDDPGTRRAIEFLLQAAGRRLRMDAAFLAEITDTEQIHVATTGASADSFTIHAGERLPREEGYCHRVIEADAPWVIEDTSAEPLVRDLAVTAEGRLAAYIGVPVRAPDGRPYGTLCCMHHDARMDLGPGDVAVLEALADILGNQIAQLDEGRLLLGRMAAHVAKLTDVVEHHELQLEVFRRVADASLSVMLLLNAKALTIEYANIAAAELTGRDRVALLGSHPWDLHPCWEETTLRQHLAPLQSGDPWPVVYELSPVGDAPAMDVHAQRIAHAEDGGYILWQGHDVGVHQAAADHLRSALQLERQAADQLRRLDAVRNAFLSAVSHELRTPLTTVKGVTELLHRGRHEPGDQPELLERLAVNADRLDRLLADLLDLNLSTQGALDLVREPVELDALVRTAIDVLELDGHPLTLDLTPMVVEVAPVKVERIVINLVLNAVTHTPAGTPIEVSLTRHPDGALLVVTDHGAGVPVDLRGQIFEPFEQGATVPSHRPGTGIGLSLVGAFTQLHGGRVWVEDVDGGGAAFHILLPASSDT